MREDLEASASSTQDLTQAVQPFFFVPVGHFLSPPGALYQANTPSLQYVDARQAGPATRRAEPFCQLTFLFCDGFEIGDFRTPCRISNIG
jgi:hypothetical protein